MAKMNWVGPTLNTNGSVFDEPQFCGYEVDLDGSGPQSIIVAWDGDNNYEFDLASAQLALDPGDHSVRLRVVNKQGERSDWTNPAAFTVVVRPNPPTLLSVA